MATLTNAPVGPGASLYINLETLSTLTSLNVNGTANVNGVLNVSPVAYISTLVGNSASFGNVSAATGYFSNLQSAAVTCTNVSSNLCTTLNVNSVYGHITTLYAANTYANFGNIINLSSTTATVTNLTASNNITSVTGYIGTLTTNNFTANNVTSSNASINALTGDTVKITTLNTSSIANLNSISVVGNSTTHNIYATNVSAVALNVSGSSVLHNVSASNMVVTSVAALDAAFDTVSTVDLGITGTLTVPTLAAPAINSQIFSTGNGYGGGGMIITEAKSKANAYVSLSNYHIVSNVASTLSEIVIGEDVAVTPSLYTPALTVGTTDFESWKGGVDSELSRLTAESIASTTADALQSLYDAGVAASIFPKLSSIPSTVASWFAPAALNEAINADSVALQLGADAATGEAVLSVEPAGTFTNALGATVNRAINQVQIMGRFFASDYTSLGADVAPALMLRELRDINTNLNVNPVVLDVGNSISCYYDGSIQSQGTVQASSISAGSVCGTKPSCIKNATSMCSTRPRTSQIKRSMPWLTRDLSISLQRLSASSGALTQAQTAMRQPIRPHNERLPDASLIRIITSLANVNATVSALQLNVNSNVSSVIGNVSTLQGNVTSLNSTLSNVNSNISTLQSNVTTLNGNVTTLTSNVLTLVGNVTTLSTNVTTLTGNVTTLTGNVTTLTGNVTTLTTNVTTLTTNVATLTSNVAALQLNVSANVSSVVGNVSALQTAVTSINTNLSTSVTLGNVSATGTLNVTGATNLSSTLNVATLVTTGGTTVLGPLSAQNVSSTTFVSTGAYLSVWSGLRGNAAGGEGGPYGVYYSYGKDSNAACYLSSVGAAKSWAGANTVGYGNVTSYALRTRCSNVVNKGFIWENSSETPLMALEASTGTLTVAGNLSAVGGATLNVTAQAMLTNANVSWGATYGAVGSTSNTRLLLYPAGGGASDFSIGIGASTLTYNAAATGGHSFYTAGSLTMALGSGGDLSVVGNMNTGAGACFANTSTNHGAPGTTQGTKVLYYGSSGSTSAYSCGVDSGELWHNASSTGSHTWYSGGTLTGGLDRYGSMSGTLFNTSYKEYRYMGTDFGSNSAYLYVLAVTNPTEWKKVLSTTCTFVAKTSYVRVTINGNIWNSVAGTTGIFGCLATNSAGTTFVYPVGVGSAASGYTEMGSVIAGTGNYGWDCLFAVTAGVTYWPAIRFASYFSGNASVCVTLCTIEHINNLT